MDSVGRRSPKWKPLLLWVLSPCLVLLLALLLMINHHHIPHPHLRLRHLLSGHHPLRPSSSIFLPLRLFKRQQQPPDPAATTPRPPCVRWMAPFLSGGGYSSEAWSYVAAIRSVAAADAVRIKIDHHGDLENPEFWFGLPEKSRAMGIELHSTECPARETIFVCHSEPGAWHPPMFQTPSCPPDDDDEPPLFVVGRTMFETDRLTAGHVERCNRMDEIWVPTDFHVSTFSRSGVDRSKIVKVVQPIDVDFFDPSNHEASIRREKKTFVFLSVFKWEKRKGWDVLLKAYLQEFSASDSVALYLLISAAAGEDIGARIADFAGEAGLKETGGGWAAVRVIGRHVPQLELPALYKAADAFVLPSRGEGWGRPVVEAMAMGLPAIATNWSGVTEYLTEENGYPLPVERMSEVEEGPFKGHLWAEPSVEALRGLMRAVASDPEEARRRGRRAREDMVERFSPEVVGRLVVARIMEIAKKFLSK